MAALNSKVRKAVIPVAGLGTRMLPATKAIPKEMLPLVDKPLIQYVVNECIAAGITEIVLVTHSSKNSIENHFDTSFELEAMLEKRVKRQLLEEVQSICPPHVTIMQVRQGLAKGLGHAVMCAHPVVGDEIQLTDAIDMLIEKETVEAYHMKGKSHDCGNKLGYMQAFVEYGIRHNSLGEEFKAWLNESMGIKK